MPTGHPTPLLTGVVLAGGRSTRLGTDKAGLEVDGEPLVTRVGAVLASICEEVLIASGDGTRLGGLPWRQIADVVPDAGPLAGIVAALEVATTPLVAVAAVDLPFADPEVFVALMTAWNGEVAVVPEVGGRIQPLHAVWARKAAVALRAALEDGDRSPSALALRLGARVVPAVELPGAAGGRFAWNLNRPGDLTELERLRRR